VADVTDEVGEGDGAPDGEGRGKAQDEQHVDGKEQV
jgi:hypothetical protein